VITIARNVKVSNLFIHNFLAFRTCKRKLDFFRLPKIIVFQLKRFSYGKYKKNKLNNRVKIK
jgi:hypothetical protein